MANLRSIPKVEFHRHLDGSVRFETILSLAKENQLDLGTPLDFKSLYKKCKILAPMESLQAVLDTFWTTQKVMHNYYAIKRIAYENVEDCYKDGCVLAELRFAPAFIQAGKRLSFEDIINGVLDGVVEAMNEFPIKIGLIFIIPRSIDLEINKEAFDTFLKIKESSEHGHLLVGFDLADQEATTRKEDYASLVKKAREAGLGITIHSGEDTTAEDVVETIKLMSPTRIGHGIRIWNDEKAMELVKERGVHLEVCPTSNWLTKCVPSIEEHPIKKLDQAGISLSINSDDPHIMNIDLTHEYGVCEQTFGMNHDDFFRINSNALKYSFLPEFVIKEVEKNHFPR